MSNPRASVIIPCRNAMDVINDQINALGDQVGGIDFEVLIVDNGLNTGLETLVMRHSDMTIRVVDASDAPGTAYARNRGIEAARGDALLFCDADDIVFETWVRDGVAMLEDFPAFNGGAVELSADVFDLPRKEIRSMARDQLEPRPDVLPSCERGGYPILLGCSFGMRRAVALELGGFDESFGSQAEDNDLGFRFIKHLGFVPDARHVCVAYRLRPAGTATFRRGFEAGRKHAMVCARHDTYDVSPSFQGHWVLRPALRAVRGKLSPDALGRWIGCVVGRVRYSVMSAPKPVLLTEARR